MNIAIISPPAHLLRVCNEHMLQAFSHLSDKLTGLDQFPLNYYYFQHFNPGLFRNTSIEKRDEKNCNFPDHVLCL
jgi:hypothetical protein